MENAFIKLVGVGILITAVGFGSWADSYTTLLHRYERQIEDQQHQMESLRANLLEKEQESQRWQQKAVSAKEEWSKAGQSVIQAQEQVKQIQQQKSKVHTLLDAAHWSVAQGQLIGQQAHQTMAYIINDLYKTRAVTPRSEGEWALSGLQRYVFIPLRQLSEMTTIQTTQAERQEMALRTEESHWRLLEHQRLQQAETWRENQEHFWSRWQTALKRKQALEDQKAELEQSAQALQIMLQHLKEHRDQVLAERREAQKSNTPTALNIPRGSLPWPVAGQVIQRFGRQYSKDLNQLLISNGIKIQAAAGQVVRCIEPGHVLFANTFHDYGQLVIVQHSGGLTSVYGGLKSASVHENETVSTLAPVGVLGESGSFYFELRHEEEPIDPLVWLASQHRS